MPTKKRKYEARFPPARIKKIMQTDEEIGKVAAAVPVIISRSLEIFLQSLVETTAKYTSDRKAKTMTTSHLKQCIEAEKKFDFLKDLVANIADISTQEEEECGDPGEKVKKQRKPRALSTDKKRKRKETDDEDEDSEPSSDNEEAPTVPLSRSFIPPISSMTSSVPSPLHRSSHSIDSIIGNATTVKSDGVNQPLPPTVTNQSFSMAQTNFSSFLPHSAIPMTRQDDDEDDDYDT